MKRSQLLLVFVLLLFHACYYEDIPRGSTTINPNRCVGSTLSLSLTTTQNATGCGKTDGNITVNASGGASPYQYSLNGGSKQNSTIFSNLGAGTYSVTVYDANPCSFLLNNIAIGAAGSTLAATSKVTANNGCLTPNGSVQLGATGGSSPYQYSFNASAFSTTSLYSSLSAGTYNASVKDATGCAVNISVTIAKSASISYSGIIQPIITKTCAVANCHASGGPAVDLSNWAGANLYAAGIKTRTADGSMPKPPRPGGSLTADQIKQIACWVDEGALNN
jgi:SprB repeat